MLAVSHGPALASERMTAFDLALTNALARSLLRPGVSGEGLLETARSELSVTPMERRSGQVVPARRGGRPAEFAGHPGHGGPEACGRSPAGGGERPGRPALTLAALPVGESAVGAGPDDLVPAGHAATADRAPARAAGTAPAPSADESLEAPADGVSADPAAGAVQRVQEAAEVLRGHLKWPGGFHWPRAAGIAVRLTWMALGGAQERALDV